MQFHVQVWDKFTLFAAQEVKAMKAMAKYFLQKHIVLCLSTPQNSEGPVGFAMAKGYPGTLRKM